MAGINERYGDVDVQATQTMQGMLSNIVDNGLLIMNKLTEGVTYRVRGMIEKIASFMEDTFATLSNSGIGGLFEKLVPPALQQSLKLLVANFIILGRSLGLLKDAIVQLISTLLPTLLTWFNNILSVINPMVNVIANCILKFYSIFHNISRIKMRTLLAPGC